MELLVKSFLVLSFNRCIHSMAHFAASLFLRYSVSRLLSEWILLPPATKNFLSLLATSPPVHCRYFPSKFLYLRPIISISPSSPFPSFFTHSSICFLIIHQDHPSILDSFLSWTALTPSHPTLPLITTRCRFLLPLLIKVLASTSLLLLPYLLPKLLTTCPYYI